MKIVEFEWILSLKCSNSSLTAATWDKMRALTAPSLFWMFNLFDTNVIINKSLYTIQLGD